MSLQLPTDVESLRSIHDACETFETNHAVVHDCYQAALEIRCLEISRLPAYEHFVARGVVFGLGRDLEEKTELVLSSRDRPTKLSVMEPYLAWGPENPREMSGLVAAVRDLNRRAIAKLAETL